LGRGDRPGPGSARDRDHGHAGGWDREGDRDDALLPFGMWWKNPEVVNRIGLTLDQQKRILDFFIQSRVKLITLHATLQEEQLLLEPILDVTHLDSAKALAQIDKIADTRADLEKTNARMLLNIRGVLTPDQWATLRSHDHGPRDHDNRGPQGPSRSN
jgi:Spy/CpxP family protein refolding chaperone